MERTTLKIKGHITVLMFQMENQYYRLSIEEKNKIKEEKYRDFVRDVQEGNSRNVEKDLVPSVSISDINNDFYYALNYACSMGHERIFDIMVENGLEIEDIRKAGYSPLYLACSEGRIGIVERIINIGLEPGDIINENYFALTLTKSEFKDIHNLIIKKLNLEIPSELQEKSELNISINIPKDMVSKVFELINDKKTTTMVSQRRAKQIENHIENDETPKKKGSLKGDFPDKLIGKMAIRKGWNLKTGDKRFQITPLYIRGVDKFKNTLISVEHKSPQSHWENTWVNSSFYDQAWEEVPDAQIPEDFSPIENLHEDYVVEEKSMRELKGKTCILKFSGQFPNSLYDRILTIDDDNIAALESFLNIHEYDRIWYEIPEKNVKYYATDFKFLS